MNLRWGITPNLTMNGTVNPDFSQVESDAGQFSFDPRQALFFPEKRPFFLDGIEQFATPNNLIYTRRVAAPIAAAKITGKVTGRTNLAFLSAVDDASLSASGSDHPVFNILRVQQDVGAQSRAALVYTDRIDGNRSNRVIASDARFVWRDIYSLTMQGALSRTRSWRTRSTSAPLWQGVFARAGRRFAMRYTVRGVDPDFRAAAGFISRTGVASGNFNHQVITYGKPGSALERWSSDVVLDGTWQYDELMAGRASQDRKLHFNNNFTFRGGWRVGGSVLIETFGYDQQLYADYFLGRQARERARVHPVSRRSAAAESRLHPVGGDAAARRRGDRRVRAVGQGREFLRVVVGRHRLPEHRRGVEAHRQAARRRALSAAVVPAPHRRFDRRHPPHSARQGGVSDRAADLRARGRRVQQRLAGRSARRFAHRTCRSTSATAATGAYERAAKTYMKSFRADWLFSYQPTPGTVLFAGYGNTLANLDEDPRTARLRRTADGFFLKLSYLFRL